MCIICRRGGEPSHQVYTETTGDDFRWMTTVNRGRGKKCNYCISAKVVREKPLNYGILRPYPVYMGEIYEIAKDSGASRKFSSQGKSMSSKAHHADFGCHRFTLEPIKQSLFINHFRFKEERLINGLEVLRDIASKDKAEWINKLISSDGYQDLINQLTNKQTAIKAKSITDEILDRLSYQPPANNLEVGWIVEIITGPFKGEKAVLTDVSKSDEVGLELYEQPIPMCFNMRTEHVRRIEIFE